MKMTEREIALQELHDDYWDCECSENYIHAKSKGVYCPVCDTYEIEGMPDSRVLEVEESYDPKKDKAIPKQSICPQCKRAREYGWCCACPEGSEILK